MVKLTRVILALLVSLAGTSAIAQQGELDTQIELGAIFTSGNSEDENINFKGSINYGLNDWDYGFSVDGFRSSKNDTLNAQRIYYVGNANYTLSESSFVSTRLAHDNDKFSGYDSQTDLSVNYGRNMSLSRSNMGLTLNAGVGLRQSKSDDGDFDEGILRLAGNYNWDISETASFKQDLSAESGNETSIFRSESSIETNILDNLSLKFSINIKHQTEVPVGRKKTDTETAVTFVLDF